MKDQINRLGFAAWADNLIANAIENMPSNRAADYDMESDDINVAIRVIGNEMTATVRAYVPGEGWQYHDRVIKLKGLRR